MKKPFIVALALAIATVLVLIARKNGAVGATEQTSVTTEHSQPEITPLEQASTVPADAGMPEVAIVTNKVTRPRTVDIVVEPQFGGAK